MWSRIFLQEKETNTQSDLYHDHFFIMLKSDRLCREIMKELNKFESRTQKEFENINK